MNKIKLTLGALVASAVVTTQASAALVSPPFLADDAITVGTAVLGGLALIWGIRKAMSMAK